jgi:hypothetical protein
MQLTMSLHLGGDASNGTPFARASPPASNSRPHGS